MKAMFLGLLACVTSCAFAVDCDLEHGKRAYANKCAICHVSEADAPHTVGPNLHAVFERSVGKVADFTYSEALLQVDGQWDASRLDAFLKSPAKAIPGTAMPFQGLRSDVERRNLICFIQQLK